MSEATVKRIVQPFFDYFVVLDFEATCEQNVRLPDTEIIEFPSVLVDAVTTTVVSEFQRYVRPTVRPKLTPFCTELTGITQDKVDAAQTFPTVLMEYLEWLRAGHLGEQPPDRSFAIVTCGDWDLKTALPLQLQLSQQALGPTFVVPSFFRQWVNIKVIFEKFITVGRRPRGMPQMLEHYKKPLLGRHHSGLDDCRNIATLLICALREGVPIDFTSRAVGGLPQHEHFTGDPSFQPPPRSIIDATPAVAAVAAATASPPSLVRSPSEMRQASSVISPDSELIPLPAGNPVEALLARETPQRMADKEKIAWSKKMSHALRHGGPSMGLAMTRNGYVALEALLGHKNFRDKITASTVAEIVRANDKQRFAMVFGEDGLVYVRANQGHTIDGVEVEMPRITCVQQCPTAVHGTYSAAWPSIQVRGLSRMRRLHVHFAKGLPGEGGVISGMRKSCDIYVFLDVAKALADGMELYESKNGVILSPGFSGVVPPKYFAHVVDGKSGEVIFPKVAEGGS